MGSVYLFSQNAASSYFPSLPHPPPQPTAQTSSQLPPSRRMAAGLPLHIFPERTEKPCGRTLPRLLGARGYAYILVPRHLAGNKRLALETWRGLSGAPDSWCQGFPYDCSMRRASWIVGRGSTRFTSLVSSVSPYQSRSISLRTTRVVR